MAISYPLDLPHKTSPAQTTIAPSRIELAMQVSISVNRSPFTFTAQTQKFSGDCWVAGITLPMMERTDAECWICFLMKLKGQYGHFRMGDPLSTSLRGAGSGDSPLVNGADQTGTSLDTDGWTISTSDIVLRGDFIQIGSYLYKVLDSEDSNGSGEATLEIWPPLRSAPADDAPIVITDTTSLFRLKDSTIPIVSAGSDGLYDLSFTAVEYL